MGRRGPAPTPTAILRLRGSRLAGQRGDEPRPPRAAPARPDWLDDEGRAAWQQLVPMLRRMRVLTKIDGNALARYCQTWVRWRRAEEFIARNGEVYTLKDDKGQVRCVMQWPQVSIANKLAIQLLRLEQEFGLTPSARTRIQVDLPREVSEEDRRYFGD